MHGMHSAVALRCAACRWRGQRGRQPHSTRGVELRGGPGGSRGGAGGAGGAAAPRMACGLGLRAGAGPGRLVVPRAGTLCLFRPPCSAAAGCASAVHATLHRRAPWGSAQAHPLPWEAADALGARPGPAAAFFRATLAASAIASRTREPWLPCDPLVRARARQQLRHLRGASPEAGGRDGRMRWAHGGGGAVRAGCGGGTALGSGPPVMDGRAHERRHHRRAPARAVLGDAIGGGGSGGARGA